MHGDALYSPLKGSRSKEVVVTPRLSNLVEQLEEVEVTLKWRGIQRCNRQERETLRYIRNS